MKRTLMSIAAVLSLSVFSGQAPAENGHSYNGSFCKPWLGSQSGDFRFDYNGILNRSNGYRWINCPVIEDNIGGDNVPVGNSGTSKGTTRVWGHWTTGSNANHRITCYLYSNNAGGTTALQTRSSSDAGGGFFDMDSPAISVDEYWGDFGAYCYLPAGAKLNMIWFGEKG